MMPERYQDVRWEDVREDVRAKVKQIRESKRGMYIHGGVGCGKTHTAYAILRHLKEEMLVSAALFNTTELIFDIRRDFDRYEKKRWEETLTQFRGVLILDDIGSEKVTDFVLDIFYLIINTRYNEMLPTIFTSNLSVAELADRIGDRTASRIVEMCDIIHLTGDDRRLAKAKKS